jgi:hypothetical protein
MLQTVKGGEVAHLRPDFVGKRYGKALWFV